MSCNTYLSPNRTALAPFRSSLFSSSEILFFLTYHVISDNWVIYESLEKIVDPPLDVWQCLLSWLILESISTEVAHWIINE
jgi:hypothetical protein